MGTEIWCLLFVIALLSGVLFYQQIFFAKQIQNLVDKLMSKSFSEYQAAKEPPPPRAIQFPVEPPEDLRALQEFKIF